MNVLKSTRQRDLARRQGGHAQRRRARTFGAGAPAGMPRFLQRASSPASEAYDPTRPNPAKATEGHSLASRTASEWAGRQELPPCCDQLEDAKTFAGGAYGPTDIIGAGGVGGFTAWYFPFGGPGVLHLQQSSAAAFKDLLVVSAGAIAPHPDLPTTPELSALAARIQAMPEPDRSSALASYQWSAAEQSSWLNNLEHVIEDTWGWQHSFFLNRPCWDWIGADVNVDISLHTGPKTATDHMDIETYKTPPGESLRTFAVSHRVASGSGTDARDQSMRLASTSVGLKEYDLLRQSVNFDHDSDVLTNASQTALRNFIARYNGATTHAAWSRARIDLIGHTSSSGSEAYNQDLSERRAEAVRVFLESNGLSDAPIRVHSSARGESEADQTTDNASDRRVDLVVDGGARMNTAAHEFGHAFGLDDEYATSGSPIGSNAGHHELVRRMTDASGNHLPGAAVEHTGGIMSFGNEVRPQHYATFHHALETVTGKSPWSLGTRTDLGATEAVCSGGGMPPCTGDTCVAANLPHPSESSRSTAMT